MIPAQPIAVLPSGEGRHCLLIGSQIGQFSQNPQEWSCAGVNRAPHVHVSDSTLQRLIEQRRVTILDQERGIVALAATESSEQEEAA
jgi:hypothetical protein